MMLWTTGCSHTYGDDLEYKKQAWPFLLATKLGIECTNNAVSGGSNERIVYETLKSEKCDLVIIAWTYKERFTRYDKNNFQINFNPQLKHTLYSDKAEFVDYGKLHYAYWQNTLYSFKLWLQQIILLQNYLKQNNQRYLMLNAAYNQYDIFVTKQENFNDSVRDYVCFDQMNDDQLLAEYSEIQKYIDMIDTRCYYNISQFHITDLHKCYATGSTGHLMEEGHEEIANRLYSCSNLILSQ